MAGTQAGAPVVLVLLDGVGDVSCARLANRTPLQAANTPWLDSCARAGATGLMDPLAPGVACGSDTAHLSLLGYPPREFYRGRGAFESLGAGMHMDVGDVAFKCNFATVDDGTGVVVRRRCDRRFEEEGPVLCQAIDGTVIDGVPGAIPVRVSCSYATEHRCGVVLHALDGKDLSDDVTGTDPLKDDLPLGTSVAQANARDPARAAGTAAAINAVSDSLRALLAAHPINAERVAAGKPPANVVLLRGCAARVDAPDFLDRHGLRACALAPTRIIAGLAASVGMDVLPNPPGATGDYRTRLSAKVGATVDAVASGQYDFVFLHVKAIDDAGHDRNLPLKVRFIEAADALVGQLVRRLRERKLRCCLAITGDHSTPVEFGDHSCEPVPFAATVAEDAWKAFVDKHGAEAAARGDDDIVPPQEDTDLEPAHTTPPCEVDTDGFDEISASCGVLGRFLGGELMRIVKHMVSHGTVP